MPSVSLWAVASDFGDASFEAGFSSSPEAGGDPLDLDFRVLVDLFRFGEGGLGVSRPHSIRSSSSRSSMEEIFFPAASISWARAEYSSFLVSLELLLLVAGDGVVCLARPLPGGCACRLRHSA